MIGIANKRFLENYSSILHHHVECILKSGIILDEDMKLVLTFWDPTLIPASSGSNRCLIYTSTTFTAAGLAASFKLQSAYPIVLSLIPTALQVAFKAMRCHRGKSFRANFEDLVELFCKLHRLNKEITRYYAKRDFAVQKKQLQVAAYNILAGPGEDFLKFSLLELSKLVEKIKSGVSQAYELVPVSEEQFVACLDWNVQPCDVDYGNFPKIKANFERLSDVYLLVSSNFLGYIGLTMCVQLWKKPCNFECIFTWLVPSLMTSLQESYDDVQARFDGIRYNLDPRIVAPAGSSASPSSTNLKLLHEFLVHVQITFDQGRRLQSFLERDDADYDECVRVLCETRKHLEISNDCLQIVARKIDVFTGKNDESGVKIVPPVRSTRSSEIVDATTDEDMPELKDEEYSLSIHGSDKDFIECIEELDDVISKENLSVLLVELKRKLEEKRANTRQERDVAANPPPSPPPKIPIASHSAEVNSLLKTVMLTAQKLNRPEEVFGSGSIDSDPDDA